MHVGVVARGNEVASARVLAETLAEHHPDWPVTVLVLPGIRPATVATDEPFRIVKVRDFAAEKLDDVAFLASPAGLAAFARPVLARRLVQAGARGVLLLAPDAEVHGSLDDLADLLDEHPAVIVPRTDGPLPDDDHHPDAEDLLLAGEIDDGIVALGAGDSARALLDWWVERGRESAELAVAIRASHGVDRSARFGGSPLAEAALVVEGVRRLSDQGVGVSYWNLHARSLERRPDGAIRAGGRPLRLLHWKGFRPDRPWWLSSDSDRVTLLDDPILVELAGVRARRLLAAGWSRAAEGEVDGGLLPNGVLLDGRLQILLAEAREQGEDFGDLEDRAAADAFVEWLSEPAARGALTGINRYALQVWRERPDVAQAYPDLDGPDGEQFRGWLWVHGRPELALQPALLPPAPEWVQVVDRTSPPVLVAGYLGGTLGLGEAARGYVAALRAAGVTVATRSIPVDPPVTRRQRIRLRESAAYQDLALPAGERAGVALWCVNAGEVPAFAAEAGDAVAAPYVIGHWAWETDVVPDSWDAAFDLVDELWVNSTFVAEHLARAGDVPVVVIPTPVRAPEPGHARLGYDFGDRFVFLFAFDFFSTVARKNPVALVKAFRQAFDDGEGPLLVFKTINGDLRPESRDHLRAAVAGRSDIRVIDALLPPAEMSALFRRADCYASLHRSEGFGITLAETMALGKPVIATGYSGNTDFMTASNSYLVDHRLTRIGPDGEHYPAEGCWAEPSIDHAAQLMRQVATDREDARRRGERAARDVAATLSPEAVGALAKKRLERIAAHSGKAAATLEAPWPLGELEARIGFDLSGRGGSGLRGVAKRAVMRTLRPYAQAERALDNAVAGSLRRLWVEISAERAARERDRNRIARLEEQLAALRRGQ